MEALALFGLLGLIFLMVIFLFIFNPLSVDVGDVKFARQVQRFLARRRLEYWQYLRQENYRKLEVCSKNFLEIERIITKASSIEHEEYTHFVVEIQDYYKLRKAINEISKEFKKMKKK